jgi:hypothetical protein
MAMRKVARSGGILALGFVQVKRPASASSEYVGRTLRLGYTCGVKCGCAALPGVTPLMMIAPSAIHTFLSIGMGVPIVVVRRCEVPSPGLDRDTA